MPNIKLSKNDFDINYKWSADSTGMMHYYEVVINIPFETNKAAKSLIRQIIKNN